MNEILLASLIGLATTSWAMAGTAIGFTVRSPNVLSRVILAFATGALISALAIVLQFWAWFLSAKRFTHRDDVISQIRASLERWPPLVEICYFRKDKEPLPATRNQGRNGGKSS